MINQQQQEVTFIFSQKQIAKDYETICNYYYQAKVINVQQEKNIELSSNTSNVIDAERKKQMKFTHYYEKSLFIEVKLFLKSRPNNVIAKGKSTVKNIITGVTKSITLKNENGMFCSELGIFCQKTVQAFNIQFDINCGSISSNFSSCCLFGAAKSIYLEITSTQQQQTNKIVYRGSSERTDKFTQITFINLPINSEYDLIFRFYQDKKYIQLFGQGRLSIQELLSRQNQSIDLVLYKDQQMFGTVKIENKLKTGIKDQQSFISYMSAGMDIELIVGIDCTQSNKYSNLHVPDRNGRTPYLDALEKVCDIVIEKDTDKKVPVYGFGAIVNMGKYNSDGKVWHSFAFNGNQKKPQVDGVQGIKQTYLNALPKLTFASPTYYAPLLRKIKKQCEEKKKNMSAYTILVLFVDGLFDDYNQTKALINQCTKLPISLIIIGIGKGDDPNSENNWLVLHQFDNQMNNERDLVKFVDYQKQRSLDRKQFGQIVLEEIPRQIVKYHKLNNLTPKDYRKIHALKNMYKESLVV